MLDRGGCGRRACGHLSSWRNARPMRGSAAPSRSPTDLESVFGRQEAAWTPGRPGGAGIGAGRGSMAGLLRPQGSRPRASAGPGPKVATVRMSRGGIRKEGFKGTPGRGRKVVTAYVPAGRPRQPYDQEAYEYEDAGAYQGPVVYVDGRGRGRGRRGGRGGAWDTGKMAALEGGADWSHDLYDDDGAGMPHMRQRRAAAVPMPVPVPVAAPVSRRTAGPVTIRLTNLGDDVLEPEIKQLFEKFNAVNWSVRFDKTGRSSGVAFVHFNNYADAERAFKEYNMRTIDERPLFMEILEGRAGGGGEGSRGGFGRHDQQRVGIMSRLGRVDQMDLD